MRSDSEIKSPSPLTGGSPLETPSPRLGRALAVDPGSEESGFVVFDIDRFEVVEHGKVVNKTLASKMSQSCFDHSNGLEPEWKDCVALAIEVPRPRGQVMTYQLVDTIVWVGRFLAAWGPWTAERMDRANVKMHLCGRTTAKDTHVRQALLARFPQTGGGKTPAVGTKKQPGPLYGVKNDAWAALAVAVTYADQLAGKILKTADDPVKTEFVDGLELFGGKG